MNQIKNRFSKSVSIIENSDRKNIDFAQYDLAKSIINYRSSMIDKQKDILFHYGDWELRNTIKKIYDNNFSIKYKHDYSYNDYSVGTIGGKLDIIFFRNFFDKAKDEKYSQSEIMRYAGCITDEGAIRSMIIHELGHVFFRVKKNNKWISILDISHDVNWSNWVVKKMIKFNNIVKNYRNDLLIGFLVLKGFNKSYTNPTDYYMNMLYFHYKEVLKRYGYISNVNIYTLIDSPYKW